MANPNQPPTRVTPTAAWQAEMERRRETYAARRRRWVEAWFRGDRPEPPLDDGKPAGRTGRTIHDRRQFRFDL